MKQRTRSPLNTFTSLAWYEAFLRFVATFVAKSAELLLAAGLVVSSANFLTDGGVLGTQSPASIAWSWTQALAIDSSLGISFYYTLQCLKQRDWVKFALYSVLTSILTLVAGIITDGDIFSHATHTSISMAMSLLNIDVRLLSILRAIAVVGFVLMSRLRDVSFKDLSAPAQDSTAQTTDLSQMADSREAGMPQFSADHVALLLQALTRSGHVVRTDIPRSKVAPLQVPGSTPVGSLEQGDPHLPRPGTGPEGAVSPEAVSAPGMALPTAPDTSQVPRAMQTKKEPEPVPPGVPEPPEAPLYLSTHQARPAVPVREEGEVDRVERLERAYQELEAEGKKISGRLLAERAHVHRSVCVKWLRARQLDQPNASGSGLPRPDLAPDTSEFEQ